VTEDLKVIEEEDEDDDDAASGSTSIRRRLQQPLIRPRRPPSLSKRESSMSMNSSCSVDSDWSDEEMQELERIIGDIQDRSDAAADNPDDDELHERREKAAERWGKLKRSRNLAINKIKFGKRMTGSTESIEEEPVEELEEEEEAEEDQELVALFCKNSAAAETHVEEEEEEEVVAGRQVKNPKS
jgi:hypothetical protein